MKKEFENKKESIVKENVIQQTLEYPASMPNNLSGSDKILWNAEYNKLPFDERDQLENRQQSIFLKSISTNIAILTWISITSVAIYIFLLYFYN